MSSGPPPRQMRNGPPPIVTSSLPYSSGGAAPSSNARGLREDYNQHHARNGSRNDYRSPVNGPESRSAVERNVSMENKFAIDEDAMTQLYGLSTLNPHYWEDTNDLKADADGLTPDTKATRSRIDESDPLGLLQTGILSANPDLAPEQRPQVLLHSKAFDPKVFLATVHPTATFTDLSYGRDRLKDSLEQRSGAVKLLVQSEWDRFVSIKGATEAVALEIAKGPMAPEHDYGVEKVRDILKQAGARAENVYHPILDTRLKADRLRSTLGVFERSRFFFNLPGTLAEAIEEGKYDVALQAYKKGRYILASRPAQLLGLPAAKTPQQEQQQKRIYDKVWGQVEKIIGDLRSILGKKLRDTKRGLDEVEKTIEILLELDPSDDPVWIFFDTQHRHILHLLQTCADSSLSRIRMTMDQYGEDATDERRTTADLRTCVASLDKLDGEQERENAAGREVWRLIYDFVHQLSDIALQTLPSFWKVAKAYMEGKYQATSNAAARTAGKRSASQCRVMTQEILNSYITILSKFFELSSARQPARRDPRTLTEDDPGLPLPAFVPPMSSAASACHWLLRIIGEITECVGEMQSLDLTPEASSSLKEMIASLRWRFEETLCTIWLRDAKIFYRLETWQADSDDASTTRYLRQISSYQRFCSMSAFKIAGGSEERANAMLEVTAPVSSGNASTDPDLPQDLVKQVRTAFLDTLYAFLDGLVHVAFSDPSTLYTMGPGRLNSRRGAVLELTQGLDDDGRPFELDVNNVDTRILLTVSNLTRLRDVVIPRLVEQFSTAFRTDMNDDLKMLMDVIQELDKILFDDYVKRKSADVAKIIEMGVMGGAVDWYEAPKPTEVHPFIYDALLSLVLVHAQVSAIARGLVARTLGALVEELATSAFESFSKVERFGMGGMLQATLEIEFMHQTLSQHVSPQADATLQSIYKTISQSYYRKPSPNSAAELQQELEGLKRTLVASRRATALQFLCFRRVRTEAEKKEREIAKTGDKAVPAENP